MILSIVAKFLSITTIVTGFPQDASQRLRLIHADVFKRERHGNEIHQELRGNVELVQGETTIKCDKAIQKVNAEIYELLGRVQIFDKKQTLLADTVFVYERAEKQIASGHVINVTEEDSTWADRITYFEAADRFLSQGNVRVRNFRDQTLLKGESVDYFRTRDFGIIQDNAVLIQFDSLGLEQTRILADTLKIARGGQETEAHDNVTIIKPGITATCGYAKYNRELEEITLYDNPVVQQANQQIEGDTLHMFLKNSKLYEATVLGNGRATSDADTLNKGKWQNKLTGRTMRFYFDDERIEKAVIMEQATSVYHVIEEEQYKGANELSGDIITVDFKDGQVQKILVTSNPDVAAGSYVPPN